MPSAICLQFFWSILTSVLCHTAGATATFQEYLATLGSWLLEVAKPLGAVRSRFPYAPRSQKAAPKMHFRDLFVNKLKVFLNPVHGSISAKSDKD